MAARNRVLVAVENSSIGEQLSRFIINHCWAAGSEFMLIHSSSDTSEHSLRQGREMLKKFAEKLRSNISYEIVEKLVEGHPVQTLQEEIRNWQPDLLVMGAHGRSGVAKWYFGSTSNILLSIAQCPVVVIRPARKSIEVRNPLAVEADIESLDSSEVGFHKILVGVQDEDQAEELVRQLVNHKWSSLSEFEFLHVVDPTDNSRISKSLPTDEAKLLVQSVSQRVNELLPQCSASGLVLQGNACSTLLNRAAESGADLIVLGSHGRSAMARHYLGSVSEPVLARAMCMVVVARGASLVP